LAFGIVSSDLGVRTPLEELCVSLSRTLPGGALLYPQVLRTYPQLATQLAGGGLDVAWVPPLLAADLLQSRAAEVVATLRREAGNVYHSVIFVRTDSPIRTLADLAGRTMAWVHRTSASGYVVPRRFIAESGRNPSTLFSAESFAGNHVAVTEAVLRGSADVGVTFAEFEPTTRAIIDAGWFALPGASESVRIVASAGAVPADAIAVSRRVAPEIRSQLAASFLRLDAADLALVKRVFRSEGFAAVAPGHREALERLREPV
jgi:phosphonate transport system substrate-binding protein